MERGSVPALPGSSRELFCPVHRLAQPYMAAPNTLSWSLNSRESLLLKWRTMTSLSQFCFPGFVVFKLREESEGKLPLTASSFRNLQASGLSGP